MELAELTARAAITDCLHRYCRGIDRADLPLILSAFHLDAKDNHSGETESAVERFTRTVVQGMPMRTSHQLSNIVIELDGHRAAAQSYMTAWHQFEHDGETWNWVLAGRYLDRLECRSGDWRIAERTVVYDIERFERAAEVPTGHPATGLLPHATRGVKSREDPMYGLLKG
ncbi:MAG: nuclear transport factor 2 family protein [Sphingomonadales bacterium]|nr:nuclear transport factor 2 family protein [Sphingomonadales bacterium]